MKIYAQIIDNQVSLIGDEEVGLPLSKEFLTDNPHVLCIDITDLEIKPKMCDYYEGGKFYTAEEWNKMLSCESEG